jgi:hypothetical protein
VVADRKCFAGDTMALAAAPRCRVVPLLPQTVGLRQALVDDPTRRALPLLWERPGRRKGERETSHGASGVRPSRWKTAAGEGQEMPLRWLVVASTPWAKAKAARRAAVQQRERGRLSDLQAQWPRRTVAGEAEADQAATLGLQELRGHHHQRAYTGSADGVPATRITRGRPPQGASRPQRQVWRVHWPVYEATEAIRPRAQRERRVVLVTDVLARQDLATTDLLRAHKGQPAAELSCTWAKPPAAIAPSFLETPTRIAALGGVSWLALRVSTLVERQVRRALVERGATRPDRPAPRQRPTARTVFQLMRNSAVVTLEWTGRSQRRVTRLNSHQLHVISLLGCEAAMYALPPRNAG